MKKRLFSLLSISILLTIIASSCSKNFNTNGSGGKLNETLASLKYTPQAFTITAGRDTIVYGKKGTILHFYPNSFKDASGKVITSGIVNLQITEIQTLADMILNRTNTVIDHYFVFSCWGQLQIFANINGQDIQEGNYGIGFKQAAPSTTYTGMIYEESFIFDSVIYWVSNYSGIGAAQTIKWSVPAAIGSSWITSDYYFFDSCTKFHWVACVGGGLNCTTASESIDIQLPDSSFSTANTEVFIVYPEFKAVVANNPDNQLYDASTNTITIGHDKELACLGMQYELIVLANKNGLYYYQTSGIIYNNNTIKATLSPITKADLLNKLQNL